MPYLFITISLKVQLPLLRRLGRFIADLDLSTWQDQERLESVSAGADSAPILNGLYGFYVTHKGIYKCNK